jgi:glycine dehydrogenase subunit 1
MANISLTRTEIAEILNKLSLKKIDDLFEIIPNKFKFNINKELDLTHPLSEQEIEKYFTDISSTNKNAINSLFFMGGGSYDHYIPKVVDTISSRSEFYTAYTPYQPEVSQGTLQYLYEFQSMICSLSGMDVSNASLYDGASAVAEACSMAISATRKNKILLSSLLHPNYVSVIRTYLEPRGVDIVMIENSNSNTCIKSCLNLINEDIACIVVQSPNYYGIVEDWSSFSTIKDKALLIAVSDPVSMSLLKSPGDAGADIYVGEGQTLGNYMEFGGPYLGLLSCTKKFTRKIPGRIIGKTVDIDGNEAYSMVLQTREQHIRRDKATSNICTNQGLLALRATIYMSLMGKTGISDIAKLSFNNAQYAADMLEAKTNFKILNGNRSFLKEFIITSNHSSTKVQNECIENSILIDRPLNDNSDKMLLLAFTEKRTKDEIDALVSFLSTYE